MRKITVYVKVPSMKSLETGAYNHTFLQLGDSMTEVYGFDHAAGVLDGRPGRVVNDSWRLRAGDYQAKMTFEVTDEQYDRIVYGINKAIKDPPNYNLFPNVTGDPDDRQCSMFVNDLLKSADVKTGLTEYETPYTHFGYIKMKELLEPMKNFMPDLNEKTDIDRFIRNFWGVPFSSIEDAVRNYAKTGRLDERFLIGGGGDNDEVGQDRAVPMEVAALENGRDDEEDMYAYSSFYPGC
ncbi:MAG: hypothetical protein GXX82_05780 [Syntrophorhabdus sp.]|jgi:hypothetical protein|nr:hypothetical protein [Syntrophorhabdus sp.]